MSQTGRALDARLLAAHAAGDAGALAGLYEQAADLAGSGAAQGFYLTHAYVFALEQGDPRAAALANRLRALGRL